MKGEKCVWGCGGVGHNYVCDGVRNATEEHKRTAVIVAETEERLAEARDIISVLVSSHPLNPDNALRRLDSEVVSRQVLGRASGFLTRPPTPEPGTSQNGS